MDAFTTTEPSAHWAILGAGAIGGLWASNFYRAKLDVELLIHDTERLALYNSQGLTLIKNGTPRTYRPRALSLITQPGPPISHLMVTTKAHQTLNALKQVKHRLSPESQVLLLQNGLGNHEAIRELLPDSIIFYGITTEGAYRTAPCTIIHAGEGETWIGSLSKPFVKLTQFETLKRINKNCFWSNNIQARLWQKFSVNCAINGLTVTHQCKNGDLLKKPEACEQLKQISVEIESVLALKKIALSASLFEISSEVLRQTENNTSSMLQDFNAGQPLELDYLNCYLSRKANKLGLAMPHNNALIQRINQMLSKRPRNTESRAKQPLTLSGRFPEDL